MGFIEENITRDEKGRLLPGHGGLKPKGANNRLPNEIKNKLIDFIAGKIEDLEDIYSEVSPKDKLRFLIELMCYVLPKQKELLIEDSQKSFDWTQLPENLLHEVLNHINTKKDD